MDGATPTSRALSTKLKTPEEIAARVAAFEDSPPQGEGVTPLNEGFFKLERMRSARTKGKNNE